MKFALSKWYLDVTAADGHAAIVYWADVLIGSMRLRMASITQIGLDERVRHRRSLRAGEPPEVREGHCTFEHGGLDLAGEWRLCGKEIDQQLLDHQHGTIRWNCLSPRCAVQLRIGREQLVGTGYVERLEMTVPAWRLPIDELRWGRAISEHHSVVWIHWRGEEPRSLMWVDSQLEMLASISDRQVASMQSRVRLHESRPIREGEIGRTLLRRVPIPRLARRALGMNERKSVSHAELQIGASAEPGWAIHEVVSWPRD